MEAIGIGVAITVISAVILAVGALLWRNREATKQSIRERLCSHEWEPIPPNIITGYAEWCVKCDARR